MRDTAHDVFLAQIRYLICPMQAIISKKRVVINLLIPMLSLLFEVTSQYYTVRQRSTSGILSGGIRCNSTCARFDMFLRIRRHPARSYDDHAREESDTFLEMAFHTA